MKEAQVHFPGGGGEVPLGKEIVTHFSILAWKFHGQRCLEVYNPWGLKESDTA